MQTSSSKTEAAAPSSEPVETEVLVVGAGPAGAAAALALATYGINTICLNKYGSTSPTPRAHIVNQRSMEIFRDLGVEAEAVAMATPQEMMRNWFVCTSMAGNELARVEGAHTHPRSKALHDLASPAAVCDLPQDRLEPILVTEAMKRGAHVRFGNELLGFDQDASGVTADILDRLTQHRWKVRAKYLIGADGGNSRVAERLGLPMTGATRLGGHINVMFKADLSKLVAHRPGGMFFIARRGTARPLGVVRMVRPWNRWVASGSFDVNGEPDLSEANGHKIVRLLLGDDSIPVEIEEMVSWTVGHLYAEQLGRGRVFCVGDAIHRHPPMNALGSNTSIQDAYNLSWKLASVLRGVAGPGLLDSYEAERQPIAKQVTQRAFENLRSIFGAIGESLVEFPRNDASENSDTASLDGASLEAAAHRKRFREVVAKAVYGFSAIGAELNHLYTSSAVVPDVRALSVTDPELDLILGVECGRRLPHVWITRAQKSVSTLDLCGKGRFSLLTGLAGAWWREIAVKVGKDLGLAIDVHVIGPGEIHEDPYGDFARACLDDEAEAVLVRPDQVVAWRGGSARETAADKLHRTLARVLSVAAVHRLKTT